MRWGWKLTTDAPHTVVADLSLISSRETVLLDGKVISDQRSMKFRNEHLVPLGASHDGKVIISTAWYGMPRCRLVVDGREIPVSSGGTGSVDVPPQQKLPAWAWACIALCIAIPVIAVGGAIPAAIGAAGASGCAAVARRQSLSSAARVGICVGITLAAWTAFAILMSVVSRARG